MQPAHKNCGHLYDTFETSGFAGCARTQPAHKKRGHADFARIFTTHSGRLNNRGARPCSLSTNMMSCAFCTHFHERFDPPGNRRARSHAACAQNLRSYAFWMHFYNKFKAPGNRRARTHAACAQNLRSCAFCTHFYDSFETPEFAGCARTQAAHKI